MGEIKVGVGELLGRLGEVVGLNIAGIALFVLVVGGGGIAMDLTAPDSSGANLLVNVASLVGGFLLLRAMVRSYGLTGEDGGRGFGAYFGLSILSGLGLLLGFVFLVIPGIILTVRWMLAYAILLSEDDATVTGALGKSWELTRGNFWPLLAAALVGVVLFAIAMAVYLSIELTTSMPPEAAVIGGNLLLAVSSVFFSALGVAAYAMLRGERAELAEVFA